MSWPPHLTTTPSRLQPKPTYLVDSEGHAFAHRTTQLLWIGEKAEMLWLAIQALLQHELSNPRLKKAHEGQERGPHLACIIGHHRQYTSVSPSPCSKPIVNICL